MSTELFFDDEEYEEDSQDHIKIAIIRKRIRDASNPLDLDSQCFKKNFRLSKEAFIDLLEDIDDKLKINVRQHSIPNIIKLATVLRFCAQGSYQLSVGNDFNIGIAQPTVSLIMKEVFGVLENFICPKYITFQSTDEDQRISKMYFYEKSCIPNVIGCVDGTHIKIVGPKKDLMHLYYNRKGFYSINAMIVCDHLMRIKYINAKNPGASHDSRIWNTSMLKAKLETQYRSGRNDFRILGDAGYPLTEYLLTPYRNVEEGTAERTFNYKHSQGRIIIERTIGVLKSRFRCLLGARELHYTPEKTTQIINVSAALHNICVKYGVEHENYEDEHSEDEDESYYNPSNPNDENVEARRIRDTIRNSM